MKRTLYQDKYNPNKTWEVTAMSHGYYLRQYICGKQYSRGMRTTKAWIKEIGILDMPIIKEV